MHSTSSAETGVPVASGADSSAELAMALTSTPRGACLARLFVTQCLHSWGHPYDSPVNETLTLITAELCANAVLHGRVPGWVFHVRLAAEAGGGRLRVEVSDTRAERWPSVPALSTMDTESESGRGLLLVASLADDWGVTDRLGGPGKTVWASVDVPGSAEPDPRLPQGQGANGGTAARRGSDRPPRR
ncbi:ATP-binding protein [Streptomyces sp. NPDC102370]|uniref:ATP-binding protein n=1 Tax=Streptomyces sp. NPDC102370 TaxID=3366163 RepID=UPI003824D4B7